MKENEIKYWIAKAERILPKGEVGMTENWLGWTMVKALGIKCLELMKENEDKNKE